MTGISNERNNELTIYAKLLAKVQNGAFPVGDSLWVTVKEKSNPKIQ